MNKKFFKITVLVITVLAFTSCSKYEEGGPLFSAKGAIVNEWEFDDFDKMSGTDKEHDSEMDGVSSYSEEMNIEKDGSFDYSIQIVHDAGTVNSDGDGEWFLWDDNTRITFRTVNDGIVYTDSYRIVRLKSNELILEDSYGHQYIYVSK